MSSITLFIVIAFTFIGLFLVFIAFRLMAEIHAIRTRNANLMYSLSHDELSNPLQSALAALGNMEHRQSVGVPLHEQDIKSLRFSLDKLVDVMRNLKVWMLLESPDLTRTPTRVNLVSLIQSIIIDLGTIADREHVDLSYIGTDQTVYIMAYEEELRRALSNLIRSGIKHSQKQVNSYVQTSISVHERKARVTIEDNGTGMTRDQLENLGQVPQRPDARTTGTSSSGLALFLVKKIILANKATLEVKSSMHEGTSYTLEFPHVKSRIIRSL